MWPPAKTITINADPIAFRQAEISDTRMFDRPAAGQAWFEPTLPDQLTLGRPDQVAIVFGRRVNKRTPGRFHTKVFNKGVEPAIQVHYRASKVKQYFKEGRALRTETARAATVLPAPHSPLITPIACSVMHHWIRATASACERWVCSIPGAKSFPNGILENPLSTIVDNGFYLQ